MNKKYSIELQDKQPNEYTQKDIIAMGAANMQTFLDAKKADTAAANKTSSLPGLHVLKKSQFYMNGDKLREHIASYKGQAIMIKQEQIKESTDETKKDKVFPSLIRLEDLSQMKKVNGNIIRKLKPESLHFFEQMALVQSVVTELDNEV